MGRTLLAQLYGRTHQSQQVRRVPDALDDLSVTHGWNNPDKKKPHSLRYAEMAEGAEEYAF
jgi:hypothetical protein